MRKWEPLSRMELDLLLGSKAPVCCALAAGLLGLQTPGREYEDPQGRKGNTQRINSMKENDWKLVNVFFMSVSLQSTWQYVTRWLDKAGSLLQWQETPLTYVYQNLGEVTLSLHSESTQAISAHAKFGLSVRSLSDHRQNSRLLFSDAYF